MRQEEKEIDGQDLEHAEERKRESELIEEEEDELYGLDEPEFSGSERSGEVIGAMSSILEKRHIVLHELGLPKRELRALEAMKAAVDGKDGELGKFIYAEDRRALLEQALAVLQPDIASISELGRPFEELMKNVGEVREKLNTLEDAQEEIEKRRPVDAKGEDGDTDDKPKPDDDASLDGPERKIKKPSSSLDGAERKEEPKPASTLAGPERKPEAKPASSLGGPEVKEAAKPATSLGDAKEIEETAKKKPWWRRPFGG